VASAGILKRISRRTGRVSWEVWWRLDDGSRGSKTVRTKDEARDLVTAKQLAIMQGTLAGHQRGKLPFGHWADEWWALWSSEPDRSPATLETTESQLRNHVRPFFERYQVRAINSTLVRKWQNQLRAHLGYASVMACRSILFRILQFAEDDGAILLNPMRKVPAPKRPIDPEVVFGAAKRRAPSPEEAGQLLAGFPWFWWDHIIALLGTGMRFGEFAGLRRRRVDLRRGVVQVVEVRYQAGRFGSGFKGQPKSPAAIREIPLARQVVEAIRRQLPPGNAPEDLVFTGPGGGPGRHSGTGVKRGTRTVLSRDNFRRLYLQAVARTADPATSLSQTDWRVLRALRAATGQTAAELTARLATGQRGLRPATVAAALARLAQAGHAATDGSDPHRWSAVAAVPGPLDHLELSGPHDLRHTFATWLEEDGIPARVIDELMGHAGGRRAEHGSAIGRIYRETTPETLTRMLTGIERRLDVVLAVANKTRAATAQAPAQRDEAAHAP
jgi:integrase